MKSKKYAVLNEFDENFGKNDFISTTDKLIDVLLIDSEIDSLDEIVFGYWENAYEQSSQKLINALVENKDKFQHIKSLFVGDIDWSECEISWIIQGNYENLWSALPNLEKLTIKGGSGLKLGEIEHNNLKHLEIITGGLPSNVISSIANAKLPNLETLILYLGTLSYGFDGGLEDIENLVEKLKGFENLKYLGLVNSDKQNHIVKVVIDSGITQNLEVIDFSNGTLIDIGAQYILDNKDKLKNIKSIVLNRSHFTEKMIESLHACKIPVSLDKIEKIEDFSNEDINNKFIKPKYKYLIKDYLKLLEKNKIDKIEIENKKLNEISEEILEFIIFNNLEVHPLYTE